LIIADKCINPIIKEQQSSSKTIETISDIHTIGHRRYDKDKKWDIPHTEVDTSEKGNADILVSELYIEPVRSDCTKEKKEYELDSC
jgi:hypothetical protein